MDTETALERVKAAQPKLAEMGVVSLSLFGSRARGTATEDLDFDFAVRLDRNKSIGLFGFVGIQHELENILKSKVDLVAEPARKPRFQKQIDRWRRDVF